MGRRDFQLDREAMVQEQLRGRGISDALVLGAMSRVPRHRFVPVDQRAFAYDDRPLPIGEGQTISQPYMVALMTQCLRLRGTEKVLEVGTGSGYQAAILAELAAKVFTIERHARISREAEERLRALGYGTIRLRVGDGSAGWLEEAPFDRIVVTAAMPRVTRVLLDQLSDGGRFVGPVGSRSYQDLTMVDRIGSEFREHKAGGCTFVPLVGEYGWEAGENGI